MEALLFQTRLGAHTHTHKHIKKWKRRESQRRTTIFLDGSGNAKALWVTRWLYKEEVGEHLSFLPAITTRVLLLNSKTKRFAETEECSVDSRYALRIMCVTSEVHNAI